MVRICDQYIRICDMVVVLWRFLKKVAQLYNILFIFAA